MSNNHNPQLGPATALVQLITEHPELPAASWRVDRDGLLSGTVISDGAHDVRPAMQAYADVLGGRLSTNSFQSPRAGGEALGISLYATWRDVRVNVWASCLTSALAEQVAA